MSVSSFKLSDIPDEIIQEYKLHNIATPEGYIYIEVNKGMYGLPQAGILAQELLEKRLNQHGYYQSKIVPGLRKHVDHPISFMLVVDDFGIKYVGKQHAQHLISVLKDLAANVGRVMSAGRGKFTPEMSNVATCWRHVDTFSENIIAKRISTYIHTDSYVRSRYGKLILCRCDSPMSAKSSDSVACR